MSNGRGLTAGEISMLQPIYGSTIDYSAVVIYNDRHNPFQPGDRAMSPNGNIYYAPSNPLYSSDFSSGSNDQKSTFVHEMGHVFQHQSGYNVYLKGLWAQIANTFGYDAYNYSQLMDQNVDFSEWNVEQQASYFEDVWRVQNGLLARFGKTQAELEAIAPVRLYPLTAECFPPGTMIDMWPRDCGGHWQKPIEDVQVGDIVVSYDGSGKKVPGTVTTLFENTTREFIKLHLPDGTTITATPGHRFLCRTGDYMELGDIIRLNGGLASLVDREGNEVLAKPEVFILSEDNQDLFMLQDALGVRMLANSGSVHSMRNGWVTHNFEVATHHNYIADGIRVHNDSISFNIVGTLYEQVYYLGNKEDVYRLAEQAAIEISTMVGMSNLSMADALDNMYAFAVMMSSELNQWHWRHTEVDWNSDGDYNFVSELIGITEQEYYEAIAIDSELLAALNSFINRVSNENLTSGQQNTLSQLQSLVSMMAVDMAWSAIALYDPLVLDLAGDGVETRHFSESDAMFDLDGDGVPDTTHGWISGEDAFLAIDNNENGVIDGVNELFGGQGESGIVELARFDENSDGVIAVSDAVFSKLLVWIDANENGISESSELFSAAHIGISSISLDAVEVGDRDNGNFIAEKAAVEFDGGAQSYVYDVWLSQGDESLAGINGRINPAGLARSATGEGVAFTGIRSSDIDWLMSERTASYAPDWPDYGPPLGGLGLAGGGVGNDLPPYIPLLNPLASSQTEGFLL